MAARRSQSVETVRLGVVTAARPDFPGLSRTGRVIANGLAGAVAALGGTAVVAAGDIRTMTLAEWKGTLPAAVAVAQFRDVVVKGGLLFSMPSESIAALVERFFGGSGAPSDPGRAFGVAERRLFERFARQAGTAIAAAWAGFQRIAPDLARCSFSADEIAFGKADDVVVVHSFALGNGEAIEIVYPLPALRGIPALHQMADVAAETVDPVWRARLSEAVMHTRLPVRSVIARPTVAMSRLLTLAPGDFIPFTMPPHIPLTVAGRLLAHGTIGESEGRAAIKIDTIELGTHFDD